MNQDCGFIEDSFEGDANGVGVWDDQMFDKPAGLSKLLKIQENASVAASNLALIPANNGGNQM